MILVEKKVLIEKRNYLNMDIQQKRNFKQRFRKFRFFNRFSRKKLFLIKRLKLSRSVFRLLS